MKLKLQPVCFAVLLAALAMGCSKPEDKYVGHYDGKLNISAQGQAEIAKLPPQYQQVAKQLAEKTTMGLDLKKDKTFAMVVNTPMGNGDVSGTWTLTEKQITLNPTKSSANGQQIAGKITKLNSDEDGKTLTVDTSDTPNASQNGSMTFTKSG